MPNDPHSRSDELRPPQVGVPGVLHNVAIAGRLNAEGFGAMIAEAAAYVFVLPLRVIGLIGGRRVRARTTQAEWWLLRQAWTIGGSKAIYQDLGFLDNSARESAKALGVRAEAETELGWATRPLASGPRRIETANVDAPRSEQLREALLEAQRGRQPRPQPPTRVAATDINASRSEQVRAAMLEAQRQGGARPGPAVRRGIGKGEGTDRKRILGEQARDEQRARSEVGRGGWTGL